MQTTAKHCRDCGAAINVKFYAVNSLADAGTEAQRELAWNDTQSAFWSDADSAAQDCGYTGGASACGRSGGWCAPYDETATDGTRSNGGRRVYFEDDENSERFIAFTARVESLMQDVPRMFAENLAQVIADDTPANVADDTNSVAADPSRPLTAVLPLRVVAGRVLVDARGRVLLRSWCTMSAAGYIVEDRDNGLSPTEADANVHTIACAVNNAGNVASATPAGRVPGCAGQWIPAARCARLASILHMLLDESADTMPSATWDGNETAALRMLADDMECGAVADDGDTPTPHGGDAASLAQALQAYVLTVAHLQKTTNPGEWETHGDWQTLANIATRALATYDMECGAVADDAQRIEAPAERDPNVSPRIGDVLPLNAPRLCDPEPRGDGTQCRLVLVQGDGVRDIAEDYRGTVADIMHARPQDITGALVDTGDGEYSEVWLTESSRPFDLRTASYVCVVAPDGDA